MKKNVLWLALLTTVGSVYGVPINKQQAQRKAEKFFLQRNQAENAASLKAAGKISLSAVTLKGQEKTPAYYVFNREGGGYAIVAADDSQPDILGYADHGSIDGNHVPDAMLWWLETLTEDSAPESLKSAAYSRDAARRSEEEKPSIAPLMTTKWGQNTPYNDQTPVFEDKHAPAGCAATAMAQIMHYQQWPDTCSYVPPYGNYEMLLPTTFDYDLMLDSYSSSSPQENIDAVAKLMMYAGYAFKTTYKKDNASAKTDDIYDACRDVFRFSEMQYWDGDVSIFADQLYESLENGDPVLFGGSKRNGGGHVFVCEGYENGYFYFNWGWNGANDGYFLLSNLNPAGNSYNVNKFFVTGLHKPANPPEVDDGIDYQLQLTTYDIGFCPDESKPGCLERSSANDDFEGVVVYSASYLHRDTHSDIGCALALCDSEGNMISILADTIFSKKDVNKPHRFEVSFGAGIPDGNYRLSTFSHDARSSQWLPDEYSDIRYVEAVVSGNHLSLKYSDLAASETVKFYATYQGELKYLERQSSREDFESLHVVGQCSNNNDVRFHTIDYGIGLYQGNTLLSMVAEDVQILNGEFDTYLNLGAGLTEGDYLLKVLCRERGMDYWVVNGGYGGIDVFQESPGLPFSIIGNRLLTPSDTHVQGYTRNIVLESKNPQYSHHFVRNSQSGSFERIPLGYQISLSDRPEKYYDHQLRLWNEENPEAYSNTRYGIGFGNNYLWINDTITVGADVPDGLYRLKAFTRPASHTQWTEDVLDNPYQIYCIIREDTLHLVVPEDEKMKYVNVSDFNYELYDLSNETHQYRMLVDYQPNTDESVASAIGVVWLSYTDDQGERQELPVVMDVYYEKNYDYKSEVSISVKHPIHGDYSIYVYGSEKTILWQGTLFDEAPVLSVENFKLYSEFGLPLNNAPDVFIDGCGCSFDFVSSPETTIKGNCYVSMHIPADSTFKCREVLYGVLGHTPINLQAYFGGNSKKILSHAGDSCFFEVGYIRGNPYSSSVRPEYVPVYCSAPYVIRGWASYTLAENGRYNDYSVVVVDTLTVPMDAVEASVETMGFKNVTFTPSDNPNCIYYVGDSIPSCLADRNLIENNEMPSFHLYDGFPTINYTLYHPQNYSFTRTFTDGVWSTFFLPFTPDEQSWEELKKLQFKVLAIEGNSLRLVELGTDEFATPNGKHMGYIYLVRGNGETITFWPDLSMCDFRLDEVDYGHDSNALGERKDFYCAVTYNNYYTVTEDGTAFVLSSGTAEPFRSYIVPIGWDEEWPDRLEIPQGSSIPTTIGENADSNRHVVSRTTADGRLIQSGRPCMKGVVIERYNDGTARKVIAR